MGITSQKIAELAGVSRGTVDRALNHRGGVKPQVQRRIEELDDEIRVTVIATGFDKNPADDLPKIGTFAKPPVQLEGQEKDEQPKAPFAPIEPIAPAEEKPAEPEEDPFDDIFKIFNRRD